MQSKGGQLGLCGNIRLTDRVTITTALINNLECVLVNKHWEVCSRLAIFRAMHFGEISADDDERNSDMKALSQIRYTSLQHCVTPEQFPHQRYQIVEPPITSEFLPS